MEKHVPLSVKADDAPLNEGLRVLLRWEHLVILHHVLQVLCSVSREALLHGGGSAGEKGDRHPTQESNEKDTGDELGQAPFL